jgi:hypothetical protein
MNLNMKIQAPSKNFQAPWRPGALYLSTPDQMYVCVCVGKLVDCFVHLRVKLIMDTSALSAFDGGFRLVTDCGTPFDLN